MNAKRRETPFQCGDLAALDRYSQLDSSPKEREAIEAHLCDCPKCREIADDFFARPDDLWLSSIALGTLRGNPSPHATPPRCPRASSSSTSSRPAKS